MEKEKKVSIWVVKKDNVEKFDKYIEQEFTFDEVSSKFMKDYKIEDYSTADQEAEFLGLSFTKQDLEGCSYIESFVDNLSNDQFLRYDGIIVLFDFAYDIELIKREPNYSRFLGTFDYTT